MIDSYNKTIDWGHPWNGQIAEYVAGSSVWLKPDKHKNKKQNV